MNKRVLTIFIIGMLIIVFSACSNDEKITEKVSKKTPPTAEVTAEANRRLAGKLTLDQMYVYKSLSNYQQAPELAGLVSKGELAPLKERLPKSPAVIQKEMMSDGIGEYGGVWRDTFAVPVESWNWAAGHTQGYFGINQIVQEGLVELGPMWMMAKPQVLPRLATDWEWSKDGKALTMHLIEGAKWSDGEPFTADDVLFTYNHMILDPKVSRSITSATTWTFAGKVTELEKVDDYTIKWHFGVAKPVAALYNMVGNNKFAIAPAHIYKPQHPAFNSKMSYSDFENIAPPTKLPVVTMGPYVPVEYRTGQMLILTRNPYFWQVDEEGKQLPYFDEVWFTEAKSGEVRTLNLINGSGDRTNIENPSTFSMIKQATLQKDYIDINFGPFDSGYHVYVNMSKYASVKTEKDKAKRNLFRNTEFRKALSYAANREGIAKVLFPNPRFVQAWYGAYPSGSIYYNDEDVTAYKYNVAKAKEIIVKLGFKDTDGNGIVNWTEGVLTGEDLVIVAEMSADQAASISIAEALIPMYREIGIKLVVKPLQGNVANQKDMIGDYDLRIVREDARTVPDTKPETLGPVNESAPWWHLTANDGNRDLLAWEEKLADLLRQSQVTIDPDKKAEIFSQVQQIYTKNCYTIPLIEVRRGIGVNNRIRNIAPDTPAYQYDWTLSNFPLEILWTPKAEQKTPQHHDKIVIPDSYK